MTELDQNTAHLHKELEALRARVADLEKAAAERQRDHEALQASEQRYRAIVEDQTEFVSRHTTGGVLTFVNEALCRYVGMSREELVGQSYLPFIFDEDREILLQHLSSLTCENPVDTIEHRVMLDNRGVRWLLWTNRAIFGEAGRFVEFQSVGRDITERRRAEESLKETTDLLEHLLKVSPAAVYRCEPSGSYPATFISANVERQLGYEPHQFTNDPQFWASHIHPDDAPRVFAELPSLFDGDGHTHDYRFLHQDGTYRWMRDELRLTRDAQGDPVDIVGSWMDITDRKRAELELAEAGQRLDYLLSSSPAVVYSCGAGPEYATTFISDNISALLGYHPEDFYNDPRFWEKAVHPDDRSRILAKLHRVERGEALSYEYRFRHAGGRYVWLHDKLIPIQDADGRVIEIIGSWFDVSARREAEEALRESEARYRNLFDRVPVGLYRTTPDGQILDANLTLIEMLGYPDRDTLLRAGASSRYAEPDARDRLLEQINRTGVARNLEFELQRSDGTRIWVRESVRVVRDADGAVTSYEGSLEDITKRRRAMTELEGERQKLRSYFDTMIDGVGIANKHGEIVDVNQSLVRMLGYESREDLVGKTVFDIAGVQDRSTVERRFAEAIQDRTLLISGLESSYRRRDGSEFPVLLNITNLWSDDGTFAGNLAVIRDITEQKRAELALRESEERYRAIVNDQTELICRFTPGLTLTFVNDAYCRYFGKSAEDLVGHSFLALIPSEDHEKVRQHLAQLTLETPVASHEHMVLGAHGEVCWQQWTNRVIVGDDGAVRELQAVGRDVTERKAAEQAREQLESQLRHSHKLRAVGQLAAGVAHDFNSLLAVILGNAELMKRRLTTQETDTVRATATASLDQIVDAVERGRSLVRKLLTFGRARTWKPQAIELNTVVTGMRQILASVLGSPIGLSMALASDLHRIKGDTMQMEQVIMNLILNARDAMPEGGELTIETANVDLDGAYSAIHAEATPGPHVRLTVKDTGMGINGELLDRIFDPFFSTKFPDKGTGLGLSIVHGIVKQAGGHIIVESQLEEGTTFNLYFPAVD